MMSRNRKLAGRWSYAGGILVAVVVAAVGCVLVQGQEAAPNGSTAAAEGYPPTVVLGPEDGDRLWVFAESKDELGAGGEFQIYVDPETFPDAAASFAKFGLGVGGALPVHRHDKTEEIAYFLSGEGVVIGYENGEAREVAVRPGSVVYTPPSSWHSIRNTGDERLVLVFATIPNEKKGLLSFFRKIGAKPGEEGTALSPEEFARVAAEHDLILRPPDPE